MAVRAGTVITKEMPTKTAARRHVAPAGRPPPRRTTRVSASVRRAWNLLCAARGSVKGCGRFRRDFGGSSNSRLTVRPGSASPGDVTKRNGNTPTQNLAPKCPRGVIRKGQNHPPPAMSSTGLHPVAGRYDELLPSRAEEDMLSPLRRG